ncbi:MAG: type II toxin-antitoxin system Phd/YefM family antitoxin [Candidatus Limnocylindria bacterium]
MKTASVTEAKNQLSSLLDRVRAGESVLILDRGVPVARLGPVTGETDADARFTRLERAGLVRSGTRPPPLELLRTPGPRVSAGVSVVDAVIEERRSGW